MSNRANSLPATAPSYEICLRREIAEQRANKTFMRGTERAEKRENYILPPDYLGKRMGTRPTQALDFHG